MNTTQIAVAIFVLATFLGMAYRIRQLWQAANWLHEHEQAHCAQIGELQAHVATLASMLDNASMQLPQELIEYTARMRDE